MSVGPNESARPGQPLPGQPLPGHALPEQAGWGAPPSLGAAPNPLRGVLIGVGVGIAGGALWGVVLAYSGYVLSLIALVTGAGVGMSLARYAGHRRELGIVAAVLTAVSCLAGHVIGTYASITRSAHVPLAQVRSQIGVVQVLRHGTSFLTWAFVALGAFYAFQAATGKGRRFGRR